MNKKHIICLIFALVITFISALFILRSSKVHKEGKTWQRVDCVTCENVLIIEQQSFLRGKNTIPINTQVLGVRIDYSIATLVNQYDWDTDKALKILFCESGGNPEAINLKHETRDYSIGLFQINLYGSLANERPSKEWLLVPENNIEYAYSIYERAGGFENDWVKCSN